MESIRIKQLSKLTNIISLHAIRSPVIEVVGPEIKRSQVLTAGDHFVLSFPRTFVGKDQIYFGNDL